MRLRLVFFLSFFEAGAPKENRVHPISEPTFLAKSYFQMKLLAPSVASLVLHIRAIACMTL